MDHRICNMCTDVNPRDCTRRCMANKRESALKVDPGRKICCHTRESNLRRGRARVKASLMLFLLSYILITVSHSVSKKFAMWIVSSWPTKQPNNDHYLHNVSCTNTQFQETSHLPSGVEEFVDADLDLVKETWVEGRVQLMTHQFLHMLLNLRSKLLILKYQELQQVADESATVNLG